MLADPLWHRGLHPKQRPPVADPLIRRVEYCAPRDPAAQIRRPSSAAPDTSSAVATGAAANSRRPSSAAPEAAGAAANSRRPSISRSSSQAGDLVDGPSSAPYPARNGTARIVRRGSMASTISSEARTRENTVSKPPRPQTSGGSNGSRPPTVPRPLSRKQSLEHQQSSEEEPMSRQRSWGSATDGEWARRGSWACVTDADLTEGLIHSATTSQERLPSGLTRSLPRSMSSSSRPLSAGPSRPRSACRSSSTDRGPEHQWPTPARARCRRPSLGRFNDEDCAVPTIRAP